MADPLDIAQVTPQQLAEKLADHFGQCAKLLAWDNLAPEARQKIEEDVQSAYRHLRRSETPSRRVGWLGKYLADSPNPDHAIRCMARHDRELGQKLKGARGELQAVLDAMANKGGGGDKSSTLDDARTALLKKLGLPVIGRKAWEKEVQMCLGNEARRTSARAKGRGAGELTASEKAYQKATGKSDADILALRGVKAVFAGQSEGTE